MKKKLTILISAAFVLLAMMAQPITALGQNRTDEVTYTLDGTITGGSSGYATESEITQNGITWMVTGNTTMNPWRIGGKNLTDVDRPLYSTSALSDNITKVVVTNGTATATVNSMTLIVSPNSDFSNPTNTISGTWAASSTTTFERPAGADWSGKYFKLVYNVSAGSSNQYAQFVSAEFYKEIDASAPYINAADVEIAYNATSGSINFTIDNPVSGGALTATTESDWLILGSVGSTVPFTCTANSTAIARTATVTLTYTYNSNQTVTKNVTVTQAANPNAVDNISDITTAGTYTVQGTIVAKSQRGFIVGDGTGYVYYYNTNYTQTDYNIGDKVKLAGSVVVYGGVFEFNNSTTITAATSSNYVAEDPTVLTGEDMDARVASTTPPQLSNYVQYEGTLTVDGTHYNITSITGASTAIGSISYPLSTDFTTLNGKRVKVTGYYVGISTSTYYNTMLGTIEEVIGGDPYITANDVEITYDTDEDEIEYEIHNPVNGGVLTASTTSNWLALGEVEGTIPFTCSVNTAAASRTATVTLTYTYNRATVTKDLTVTQAGNPSVTMTIAEVRAQSTGSVITTGIVTSCVDKTAYIQDATAAICVYDASNALGLEQGQEISVSGTLSTYKGLLEITSPEVTVISSGNTVLPTLKTIAEINADDYTSSTSIQGLYVHIAEATVTAISGSGNSQNTTIAQGDNTIVVRGNLNTTDAVAVNDILTLDGNIGCFNAAQIANPQNVEVQHNTEPSIVVAPTTVNAPAEGANGTLTVTYENITNITASVYFCNAEGASASFNWITAGINNDNNVDYTISANLGEARTAYLEVKVGNVYSNLVTINQAQYVADYATLPFEFDGGRAAIDTTAGLIQEGLDSDYGSSPKLKFNSTGDYLLLKFNEEPGALTFDIKGNSFSGGTFTVQTSEDGVTYTDLETYTELGATQSELFNNLGENVRYIKWVYTEKVSGNVALGNIYLYEEGGGPVIDNYDLTVEPFENLEIFTFVGGDETQAALEGAGTIQVAEGTQVMLSISANEGYKIQSLMVDGVNHVNDITEEETYSFTMPGHNITISATAVEDIPFEPVTYKLATSIESGKSYIIVGSKTIDTITNYYAMGGQNKNNRAGVAISVDGTTATVETADVHEVVITALEEEGFYSIYDGGYLYAASSSGNQLKTLDTLNVNGQWEISIDTVAHIVASQSSNRNVMQFNYNGGSPLFSCYGSASQAPVYLYVKDETPSTVTQTIALVQGTNYVSFYVDVNLDDLKAALVAALPAGNSTTITIQSQGQNVKYQRGRWVGQLTALDMAQMYMIKVSSACEVAFEGMPIDPSTLSITINANGSTYIAFPYNTNMTVTQFFGSFPINNDQVASFTQSTKYNRGRWVGQLTTLEAGKGYIYKTESTSPRTFTFPAAAAKRDQNGIQNRIQILPPSNNK